MKYTPRSTMILMAVFLACGNTCFSQYSMTDGIQSQGEVTLERQPELMRMSVDLMAKGKNISHALLKMKALRAKAEQELVTLEAVKDSSKFGDLHVGQPQANPNRRRMQAMIARRVNQGRNPKANVDPDVKPPVDLTIRLTADWALEKAEPAELLAKITKLQENIKEANLSGSLEAEEAASEEEEEAEEEMGQAFGFEDANGPKPGEPQFVFVAKISADDRQKALADAFADAKVDAVRLAKAAGVELGALKSLNSNEGSNVDDQNEYQMFTGHNVFWRQMSTRSTTGEAMGMTTGTLKYKVNVNATFAFK